MSGGTHVSAMLPDPSKVWPDDNRARPLLTWSGAGPMTRVVNDGNSGQIQPVDATH